MVFTFGPQPLLLEELDEGNLHIEWKRRARLWRLTTGNYHDAGSSRGKSDIRDNFGKFRADK